MLNTVQLEPGSNPADLKCRGQDLNLRTTEDCDLNAAPLTKLGDPCLAPRSRFPYLTDASAPGGPNTRLIRCMLQLGAMSIGGSRGMHLYLRTLEAALEDEIVTDDEMSILHVLARAFALPDGVMGQAWAILRGQIENPVKEGGGHERRHIGDATTYQSALIAALADEVITEDEWAMLDVMRRVMGIQPDEHGMIEEAVRAMAEKVEDGDSFVSRLDRYMSLHPYR